MKTFFHLNQPLPRYAALATFLGLLVIAAGLKMGWIDVPDHDQEWFLAGMALFSCLGVLAPWIIARFVPPFRRSLGINMLGRFEALVSLMMVMTWVGAFGLYRDGWGYDTLVHTVVSACLAYIFTVSLAVAFPKLTHNPLRFVLVILFVSVLSGVINELFEWGGDQIFGTSMYGEVGEPNDTEIDFIGNVAGYLLGLALGFLSLFPIPQPPKA